MPDRFKAPLLFVGTSSIEENATQQKLYFLAAELERRGRPVSICVPDFPRNRGFFDRAKGDLEVRCVPRSGAVREMLRKNRIASAGTWSAVHLVGVSARNMLWRRRIGAAPIFYDFDENMSRIGAFRSWRRLYLRCVEAYMLSHGAGFSCASGFLVDRVRSRRPELGREILYLPVAIEAGEHVIKPEISRTVRERFSGKHVLVYVGSISPLYPIGEIVDLAGEISRRRRDFVILICGDGSDLRKYKAEVAARGFADLFCFEGRIARPDIASYLEASSVLLLPFADNEQNRARCPTKAFHYAGANRPVVTNRVGEVGRLFGESAYYYPEHDISSMADACELAMKNVKGYDNKIPFRDLTWDERADRYEAWLVGLGIWQA